MNSEEIVSLYSVKIMEYPNNIQISLDKNSLLRVKIHIVLI